ncbi:MAG TPA: secretin N-terminal domain-containing protein [Pyrinomonadaceae bacterium]|jgi:general secretion pathway protein D|nr:secretin N-terminal domain-containing protein [Pyrinomonadaceae bacterium]
MKMKSSVHSRAPLAMLLIFCLLVMPLTALAAKKGEKNFKRGMQYESAQQWDKAAQEFTLAVAADPANMDYQLHYRRAMFNASQMFMLQGRALAEQKDFVGAYNAFRQAYGYDPVNQLALSEMDRMLRLQEEKTGVGGSSRNAAGGDTGTGVHVSNTSYGQDNGSTATPSSPNMGRTAQEPTATGGRSEQLRVINYSGDLKSFIRSLSDQLSLNVIFDRQSFAQPRNIDINMHDVTTAQALDYIFLQEGLFFQKLSRRTILVADQSRRAQYQQLVIRTFYLSNTDPTEARNVIQAAIPPSQGRPQIIVIPDKSTNSLTVRDTAENVRLIGEILQSIDKDRAEVVMDVNIYEVSRTDIFQLGNQIGDANGVITLGGSSPLSANLGSNQVANSIFKTTTALGAAIIIPPTTLTAFQRKDNTKLIASTQIHAFTGEESTARIGQRVPVQTAQTYPFGAQTSGTTTAPGTNFNFPTGGFPVINYEPTGLTLKFTPQVFPNLDVQVKMSIESKDVQNPGSATPSFTERTITGTARIQNNRTMMLASVAQDKQSSGRGGLPLLGLVPVLGRLFSTPRRDNLQTDIVIAVTPRVLRAPAVTPRDEELRPSGTLSSPTIGTLEAMIQETDREDQLAEARRIPKNVQVQLPDATTEQAAYVPAPKALMSNSAETPANTNASINNAANASNTNASGANNIAASNVNNTTASNSPAQRPVNANIQPALTNISTAVGPPPARVLSDALKAADNSTTTPQPVDAATTLNQSQLPAPFNTVAGALNAVISPNDDVPPPVMVRTTEASVVKAGPGNAVELRLMPERGTMLVGERQRVALALTTSEPLGTATIKLHFDPRVIAVRGVSQGILLAGANASVAPTLMQSIDPSGALLISVQTPTGTPLKTGMNIMLFVEVEAIAGGESEMSFDKEVARLATFDGRPVSLLFVPGRITVK